LRATVVETIGAAGMKGIPIIPDIAELLLVEDNWLRTIAVTQLSKLALLRTLAYGTHARTRMHAHAHLS
jgi:hypothetical protein